jgi:hypothetical protein
MLGILTPPKAVPIPTRIVPALCLICGNCGYLEMFASSVATPDLKIVEERNP